MGYAVWENNVKEGPAGPSQAAVQTCRAHTEGLQACTLHHLKLATKLGLY